MSVAAAETFSRSSPQARLEAVLDAGAALSAPAAGCAVWTARGSLGGRPVLALAFDRSVQGGSIGTQEAAAIIGVLRAAQAAPVPVVWIIDSGGARLSEGLAALGAFRRLYRETLACRAAGVPMLALLGRDCFGGASMLAFLAWRRVYSPSTRLALSGPAIIEAVGGRSELAADDPAEIMALMGGEARAAHHGGEHLAQDAPGAFRAAALAWIASPGPAPGIDTEHETLGWRLAAVTRGCPETTPPPAALAAQLQALFPGGWEAELCGTVLTGHARPAAGDAVLLGLAGGTGPDAGDALRLAGAALELAAEDPGSPVILLLDCPGHSLRRVDETLLLSHYMSHMAIALNALAARRPLTLAIIGAAAGGTYLAVAGPAARVLALPGAEVRILHPGAVAQVLGNSANRDLPPLEDAVRHGVVDSIASGALTC